MIHIRNPLFTFYRIIAQKVLEINNPHSFYQSPANILLFIKLVKITYQKNDAELTKSDKYQVLFNIWTKI